MYLFSTNNALGDLDVTMACNMKWAGPTRIFLSFRSESPRLEHFPNAALACLAQKKRGVRQNLLQNLQTGRPLLKRQELLYRPT